VITWLGADFRGGRFFNNTTYAVPPLLVHGFVDRRGANKLLKHKGLGAFLLRFSERQPDKLVFAFNEQLDLPATHCLVELLDGSFNNNSTTTSSTASKLSSQGTVHGIHNNNNNNDNTTTRCCCISFEGGTRQVYPTLGDLVLDCRRLSHAPDGTPKTSLFKKSVASLPPEPLGGMSSSSQPLPLSSSPPPQAQQQPRSRHGIDPLQ
jgi:hypothetical protein